LLINKILPGLFNGVSQQPASLRLETQCELEENCFSSLAEGTSKRPPIEHLAVLNSKASTSSFVHTINRDETERYILILTGDASEPVEVYTLDGVKCTVIADAAGKAYLTSTDPLNSYRATTVADYTLITNTTKKCLMNPTLSTVDPPTAIVNVAKGVAAQNYSVFLNGAKVATYSSGDSTEYETYKATTIAKALFDQMLSLVTNELAVNFATAAPVEGDTIAFTLDGATIGGAIPFSFDVTPSSGEGDPGSSVYNSVTTASAVRTALMTYINTAMWGVYAVGSMLYIKKFGYSTFTFSHPLTGAGTAPTSVAPNTSSQWDIDYVDGTSSIRIAKLDGTDFTFSASDSYGNQALLGIKGKAQKFADLPASCWHGTRVEITGEPNNQFDNFHLMYSTEEGTATGVWKEVVKQGIADAFDAATMPHQLTRSAYHEFTLAPITWKDRRVGDEDSQPTPSFINSYVKDIFFYRNRLGFLAGENVIMSQAGVFFDFWATTATGVMDTDPIDISCPSNEVTNLLHAIPFPKSLFLVGAQQQFSLNSGTLNMTPKTVAVDITTHFEVEPLCQPVVAGSNVYLPVPRGNYSSLREYFITPDSFSTDAADITAHVPTYLPKKLCKLAASSSFDLLVGLSHEEPGTLYVYKYYWAGDQKAQSAWGKWLFDGQLISCEILSNYLLLVIKRGSEVSLERLRLDRANTGTLPFRVHLDRLVSVTGAYNSVSNKTVWTLPYTDASTAFNVVRSDTGFVVPTTKTSGSTIEAFGNYSTAPCWIGCAYTMRYRFSEWLVKGQGTNVGILQGRLQIRNLTLGFINTGHFTVEVSPKGRGTASYPYPGATLGSSESGVLISTGEKRTPILTTPSGSTIDIVNDTYLPSCFHTASYEGFFTVRSRAQ
jgi:hypothetical protein